ncbi:MAG: Uma2 family endonuclease [Deltaproteobacteria bacterium]|nr:Uma2 family endonuclease [Deltaproteobacteria bacterium]
MGSAAEHERGPTYADVVALPPHLVGEILGGELFASPRPAPRHARAASRLGALLGGPFDLGISGPGGWLILDEPELSLGVDPGYDPVVPDLAGWRVEVLPEVPDTAQIHVTPQWVCEIPSPGTQRADRLLKLPFYARAGVEHCWFLDPLDEALEVFERRGEHWLLSGTCTGDASVRAAPFEAIELALCWLWGRRPPAEGGG